MRDACASSLGGTPTRLVSPTAWDSGHSVRATNARAGWFLGSTSVDPRSNGKPELTLSWCREVCCTLHFTDSELNMRTLALALCGLTLASNSLAQQAPAHADSARFTSSGLSGLKLRSVGP